MFHPLALAVLLLGVSAFAHTAFIMPTSTSCPTAHCSNFAGSQNPAPPPTAAPSTFEQDTIGGRSLGLGCVSNGTLIACTYGAGGTGSCLGAKQTLVIYDAAMTPLYDSGCLLKDSAQSSVPMINTNGDVITADQYKLIRVNRVS